MKYLRILMLSLLTVIVISSCEKYRYESVPNDPLNARVYTLKNGLKVYMSVNTDEPMIQTYIAVRVGGKNDPSENTGLAHYFEHLMFKGTELFGTSDYKSEKPLLDQIEEQFEIYRNTTDEQKRREVYRIIDDLSYEASKYAIPNEYDKLMAAIGSKGTNAYTGYDQTVYIENIPSNQIENWAMIQADRFQNTIIRGFHTELETVYEEKNMSLTQDSRKVVERMLSSLYKNHPYGLQTILGTQEHLKNPSITTIKRYYEEWYVPNNMAICLAGDFDPDEMIKIIDKYFGHIPPNKKLKQPEFEKDKLIREPIVEEVYGLEAPMITLAWRAPGAKSEEIDILRLISKIMSNGTAGMLDLNVNQQQRVLGSYSGYYDLADHSVFLIQAYPKQGQSLDEVKDILFEQMDLLKRGDFEEELMTSIVNNEKLSLMRTLESNRGRADLFVDYFINDTPLERGASMLSRLSRISKDDIVNLAKEYFGDDNYVYIKKIQQKDPNEVKMPKPEITPILTNRDKVSDFLKFIQSVKVKPIEPVFVDFSKDMQVGKAKSDIEILYKKNDLNDRFSLSFIVDIDRSDEKISGIALQYLKYLGTNDMSAAAVRKAFYSLACNFNAYLHDKSIYFSLNGLGSNMIPAIELMESVLNGMKSDERALSELKKDLLKSREDSKSNQRAKFNGLLDLAKYGTNNPTRNILSESEIRRLKGTDLIENIRSAMENNQKILYYGPESLEYVTNIVNEYHDVPVTLKSIDNNNVYKMKSTLNNEIELGHYSSPQIYMSYVSNIEEKFNPDNAAIIRLYNQYFGSGMNSIVFQEMREARGLAYSANARVISPSNLEDPYYIETFIATQNDKMMEAIDAFDDILNNMPKSEAAFRLAKESLINNISTARITKGNVLNTYLAMKKIGLDYDINQKVYNDLGSLTLQDVVNFQNKWIKDKKYTIAILGEWNDFDTKALNSKGKTTKHMSQDIFGY